MSPRRPRLPAAVLWDMDGTLVDTEPYWFESERELVESYGGEWPDHHAKAVVGFDLLASARYIKEHTGIPLQPRDIVERMLDGVVARLEQHIPWRPGACRLLAELNDAGVPCALVTMSWHRFVDPVVAALPPGSFTAIVTGDDVPEGEGKPGPLPYLLGAEACGVHPEDCVAIEDSPTGVRSALRAGCHVLGVPNVRDLDPAPGLTLARTLRDIDLDTLAGLVTTGDADDADDGKPPAPGRPTDRRRVVIGGLVAVTAAIVGIAVLGGGGDEAPPALPPGAVAVDVWAPYWTLGDAEPTLATRLDGVREMSPFFYVATSATAVGLDPHADADAAERFLDTVRASDARVVPSIADGMPAGGMAAVLADPQTRSQHVRTIRDFADTLDADGIDIDYESFAFQDGSATWETTRPAWVAFIEELADGLHDDGRTLSVSIPAIYDAAVTGDRGYWVYDHGAIAEHVDAVRIMAYDYSTAAPGPIAPIAWVQQAIDGVTLAVPEEHRRKLVLGVPAYGRNWVASTTGSCPATAEGTTTVRAGTVLELATLRGGTPVYDPGTAEWSFTYPLEVTDGAATCTQSRVVQWVDAEGIAARVELARRAGWGGASLWALGYEDDADWSALVGAARQALPAVQSPVQSAVRSAG